MAWWALSTARMWMYSKVSWQCPLCGHKSPSVGLVQGYFHFSTHCFFSIPTHLSLLLLTTVTCSAPDVPCHITSAVTALGRFRRDALTRYIRWGKESLGDVGPWSGLSSIGGPLSLPFMTKNTTKSTKKEAVTCTSAQSDQTWLMWR